MHHGAHVGRGLDHQPVDQAEGKFDPLVEIRSAIGEHSQTLGLGCQVVLEHIEHVVQIVLKKALFLLGRAALLGDAVELAVEKGGRELAPVVQATGGEAHSQEHAPEARAPARAFSFSLATATLSIMSHRLRPDPPVLPGSCRLVLRLAQPRARPVGREGTGPSSTAPPSPGTCPPGRTSPCRGWCPPCSSCLDRKAPPPSSAWE